MATIKHVFVNPIADEPGFTGTKPSDWNADHDVSGLTDSTIVPNTAPAAGQILVGNAGGTAYAPVTLSGDATMTSAGVVTVTVGSGDVVGPATATDNAIARFDGATGKLIQNGVATLDDAGALTVVSSIKLWSGLGAVATNLAIGNAALAANTTGGLNVAVGYEALKLATNNQANTAVGYQCLATTDYGTSGYGGTNTAVGYRAMRLCTVGYDNSALGYHCLLNLSSGSNNLGIGPSSASNVTVGTSNVALGGVSLNLNTTGSFNTAVGRSALPNVRPTSKAYTAISDYSGTVAGTVLVTSTAHGLTGTTTKSIYSNRVSTYDGSKSITVVDANSFYFTATFVATDTGWWDIATEGRYNSAVGYNTGLGITTGSGNTILGAMVTGLSATLTDNVILASGASGTIRGQFNGTLWNLPYSVTGVTEAVGTSNTRLASTAFVAAAGGGLVYSNTTIPAGNTVANVNTEQTFTSSYTIPANSLIAGDVIEVELRGNYSTDVVPPTLTGKIKFGSVVMISTGAITTVASIAGLGWRASGMFTVQSVGASGVIDAGGDAMFSTAATTALSVIPADAAATVDTTATIAITVTVQWSLASANSTIQLRQMNVKKLTIK